MEEVTPAPLLIPSGQCVENRVSFCKNEVPPSPLSPRKSEGRHVSEENISVTRGGSPVDMYIYSALERKN